MKPRTVRAIRSVLVAGALASPTLVTAEDLDRLPSETATPPEFFYFCWVVATPSLSDQTTTLPTAPTQVDWEEPFYVEFWATSEAGGITCAYADMDYPESCVSTSVTVYNTALFSLSTSGTDDGSTIDELGGCQPDPDIGVAPEWARVAYVEYNAADVFCNPAQFCLREASSESTTFGGETIPPSGIIHGCCSVIIGWPCSAARDLSDPGLLYCPGRPKTIHIDLHVLPGATVILVEDLPPAGWTNISNMSDGGTYDSVNHKVKWGPLFAPFPTELTYDVVTPAETAGEQCFSGVISIDGAENETICGDLCIDELCCPYMAADVQQPHCEGCADCAGNGTCANNRVEIGDLGGYACAWKRGCNDDITGVGRAAYLWKTSECYCWSHIDSNWNSGPCPPPVYGCCPGGLGARELNGGSAEVVTTVGKAASQVRLINPGRYNRGKEVMVPIRVEAPEGTSSMALECEVPPGWKVEAISNGGAWDEVHRKVKWGPFFDMLSRTVSFKARRSVRSDALEGRWRSDKVLFDGFAGTVSFDGVNHPIAAE